MKVPQFRNWANMVTTSTTTTKTRTEEDKDVIIGEVNVPSQEEQEKRAVSNNRYYEEFDEVRCHKCGALTKMYFISKRPARGYQCICHVMPADLDDNIYTYDRFRAVMRPLFEQYDRMDKMMSRGNPFSLDFTKPGRGVAGDCLTWHNAHRLHLLIQRLSDVFYIKMKAANGIRQHVPEGMTPKMMEGMSPEQIAEAIKQRTQSIVARIHSLDDAVPPI